MGREDGGKDEGWDILVEAEDDGRGGICGDGRWLAAEEGRDGPEDGFEEEWWRFGIWFGAAAALIRGGWAEGGLRRIGSVVVC